MAQKVLVFDFGAQYGQLIARRVRDLHVYSEIVPCDITADEVRALGPSAIILSGGPASVYAEDAPSIDPGVLELGVPVLGFCYGHQIMAVTLGGEVAHSEVGEYGPATIERERESALFNATPLSMERTAQPRPSAHEMSSGSGARVSATHAAPASMAERAKSLPSTRSPGNATKIEPGSTWRESMTQPQQVRAGSPATRVATGAESHSMERMS